MSGASFAASEVFPRWPSSAVHKIWRELSHPYRRMVSALERRSARAVAEALARFDPTACTVEPEGLTLLSRLMTTAREHSGPVVEIGTLLGLTATHLALSKGAQQTIITVDNYSWNPWGLSPDNHFALAQHVLRYLVATGQVAQLRMDKQRFYETYAGPPPAMVFLDAMHTYDETKADILWARRVGAHYIAGHDYGQQFPGVKQVVDEFGGPAELAGTVWVLAADEEM